MTFQECLFISHQPFHRTYTSSISLFHQTNVIQKSAVSVMRVAILFLSMCYGFLSVVLGQFSVMQFCMAELETGTVAQFQFALRI